MPTTEQRVRTYGSLIMLLGLLSATSALTITSCGGGGTTNGALCEQCGDDPNGRCQGELGIPPYTVPAGEMAPCDNPSETPPCQLTLTCLRKLGSAQRRCFPFDADPQFRCDGERPNPQTRTPMPVTPTPTNPTPTPTPTVTNPLVGSASSTEPTPTPDPVATPACGDGIIDEDEGEECDGTDSNDLCEDFCDANDPSPVPCGPDCKFDFSGCTRPQDCDPNGPPGG